MKGSIWFWMVFMVHALLSAQMVDLQSEDFDSADEYNEDSALENLRLRMVEANSFFKQKDFSKASAMYGAIYQGNEAMRSNTYLLQKMGDANYFAGNENQARLFYIKLYKEEKKRAKNFYSIDDFILNLQKKEEKELVLRIEKILKPTIKF